MTDVTSQPLSEVRAALRCLAESSLSEWSDNISAVYETLSDAESTIDRAVAELIPDEAEIRHIDSDNLDGFVSRSVREAEERVGAGIALLDRYFPRWWDCIDLGTLDLASSSACICGQLFGPKAAALFSQAESALNGLDDQMTGRLATADEELERDRLYRIRQELFPYKEGMGGFGLATNVDKLGVVAPELPFDVRLEVSVNPEHFGFNKADHLEGEEPFFVSYQMLGVLWEKEIRFRQRMELTMARMMDKMINAMAADALDACDGETVPL